LLGHSLATLGTVLMGFFASVIISLPLAMLIASSPTISAAIYPLLVITQSIPKVALAPILIVALGANEMPRIIVTFLVAFFPLVVSSVAGLLAVPPELIELGRACRAGRFQELLRIRLPFAVPFVFGGLKVAAALSVVGAVVAEFVGADAGLGYLIQTSMAFFRTGCGCAGTDGYCAIPSGGAGGATVISLVQQRRRHQHSSELNGASYG
jgi:NitT/TauT family transport system permease protein